MNHLIHVEFPEKAEQIIIIYYDYDYDYNICKMMEIKHIKLKLFLKYSCHFNTVLN